MSKRQKIEETFAKSTPGKVVVHTSPSKKYRLEVTEYITGPGTWEFMRGKVFANSDNTLITDVMFNYHDFPFSWAENHPKGHDYLLCSEDYQGQTAIELDTGNRVDYLPDSAKIGFGFCWVDRVPSKDQSLLLVCGCIWAGPYEYVVYDFSDPMAMPYKEIVRGDCPFNTQAQQWETDNSITIEREITVRKSDGKPYDELTDQEQELLDNDSKLEWYRIERATLTFDELKTNAQPVWREHIDIRTRPIPAQPEVTS